VQFECYADDAVVHCATEWQARKVLAALEERMAEVGLELHPDKTRIVYCKDRNRRRSDCEHTSFTFLGYTFRARRAPTRDGTSMFAAFLPAVSKDALKRMNEEVRSWRIHLRTATELQDLAEWINPIGGGRPTTAGSTGPSWTVCCGASTPTWCAGHEGSTSGSGHTRKPGSGGTG
jgi:hypothetical protein